MVDLDQQRVGKIREASVQSTIHMHVKHQMHLQQTAQRCNM